MFAEILNGLLKQRKLKAYTLAKDTNISSGLIGDYKNAKKKPSTENLIKLADYFGVTTDYLLGRDEDPVHNLNSINQNVVSSPNSTNLVNSTNSVYLSSDDKQLLELFGRLDLLQKNQTLNFIINKIEESKI